MLHGLHVVVTAKELVARLDGRIGAHEARRQHLAEILETHKESTYIFVDERSHTPHDIEAMRAKLAARVATLTLMRNGVTEGETYALGLADLYAADLMGEELFEDEEESRKEDQRLVDAFKRACRTNASEAKPATAATPLIVDGLKLTIPGGKLRELLEHGARAHEEASERWKREIDRRPEDQTEDEPLLPTHMCENEAERHVWRADVLRFLRDYIEESATYRLGREDVDWAELLPDKPGWLEQDDYEERTKIGFSLERLVKAVDHLGPMYLPDAGTEASEESTLTS